MLIAAVILVVGFVVTQATPGETEFPVARFYYAARLIGAILVATLVPLLIDRRAQRSSRIVH
jgi:hypothetical protein